MRTFNLPDYKEPFTPEIGEEVTCFVPYVEETVGFDVDERILVKTREGLMEALVTRNTQTFQASCIPTELLEQSGCSSSEHAAEVCGATLRAIIAMVKFRILELTAEV